MISSLILLTLVLCKRIHALLINVTHIDRFNLLQIILQMQEINKCEPS